MNSGVTTEPFSFSTQSLDNFSLVNNFFIHLTTDWLFLCVFILFSNSLSHRTTHDTSYQYYETLNRSQVNMTNLGFFSQLLADMEVDGGTSIVVMADNAKGSSVVDDRSLRSSARSSLDMSNRGSMDMSRSSLESSTSSFDRWQSGKETIKEPKSPKRKRAEHKNEGRWSTCDSPSKETKKHQAPRIPQRSWGAPDLPMED